MIKINDKEYDEEEFNKNQRQMLRNIQQINSLITADKYKLSVLESYRDGLISELEKDLKDNEG